MPTPTILYRRFGSLTAIARLPDREGRAFYRCHCDCGSIMEASRQELVDGVHESCGCADHVARDVIMELRASA